MLNLDAYRTPVELIIPIDAWKKIRAETAEDELAEALCAATAGLPMPDAEITKFQAINAFQALKRTPLHELLDAGPLTLLRSPEARQPHYHTRLKPPGGAASNYLFHTTRLRTPKDKFPSAWEKWHDDHLRLLVCRRLLHLKHVKFINNATIRWALHMTGATPAQFKPGVAKAVYDLTGAQDVLDFSMGWGDRLAGFCASASTRHYTGIDPNPDLHPLYQQQIQMYGVGKKFDMIKAAAEDVALGEERFDLVFTSPPYFGVEKYAAGTGNESTQSWARYPTAEMWRDGFLLPVIKRAWAALKPKGVLAINIADIKQRGDAHPLCGWLSDAVKALPHARYQFTLGMRLQGANYSTDRRQQVSGEPIWFWTKGERELPMQVPGVLPSPIQPQQVDAIPFPLAEAPKKKNRGSPATSPKIVEQVLKDYDALIGGTTIGRKYGIDKRTVYNILIRNGRKLRTRSDRKGEATSVPLSIVAGLSRGVK